MGGGDGFGTEIEKGAKIAPYGNLEGMLDQLKYRLVIVSQHPCPLRIRSHNSRTAPHPPRFRVT